MHFQVYVPNDPEADRLQHPLERVGLGDLVPNAEGVTVGNGEGPDGGAGDCYAWRKPGEMQNRLGVFPERQSWTPAIAEPGTPGGRYWLGFWKDSPTTSLDLQRPHPHRGEPVELGDGGQWLIPSVHQLPRDIVLTKDGEATFVVKKRFESLWQSANYWLSHFTEGEAKFDYANLASFIIDILKLNYRVTAEVVNHLRLLDTSNIARPFSVFLGIDVDLSIGGAA